MQQSSFKVQQYIDLPAHDISYNGLEAVLFMKDGGALFSLLSPNNKLVLCKTFVNSDRLAGDIFLRLLFEKEKILRENFHSFRIYSGHMPFALAPISNVPQRQLLHYARLVLNDSLFEEEFAFSKIPSIESWLIFSSPFSRKHIIQEYRPDAYFGHIAEVIIHFAQSLEEEDFVLVCIYDNHAVIAAYKDNCLQLCNMFHFRANADLLYFLHSIRKATGLEGEEVPTLIMGDLDGKMKEIKEHFPHVKIPQLLMEPIDNVYVQSTPYWQFAFLNWGERPLQN